MPAVVLLVVVGILVGYSRLHHDVAPKHAAAPSTGDIGHGYLVPAPTRYKDVCLDKSSSVDRDAQLATRATDMLERRIPKVDPTPVSPYTTEPTAAVSGLNMTVRVVRGNSYDTTPEMRYIVPVAIPATPGLKEARPDNDPKAAANWDSDDTAVKAAQVKSVAAQKNVAKTLSRLTSLRSNGSDVVGCVAADLAARGAQTPVTLWIISDLENIQPKGANGEPLPAYRGAFSRAKIVISQACPGGDQAACAHRYAKFKQLLAGIGISSNRISVRPSDSLGQAYALWLSSAS